MFLPFFSKKAIFFNSSKTAADTLSSLLPCHSVTAAMSIYKIV